MLSVRGQKKPSDGFEPAGEVRVGTRSTGVRALLMTYEWKAASECGPPLSAHRTFSPSSLTVPAATRTRGLSAAKQLKAKERRVRAVSL